MKKKKTLLAILNNGDPFSIYLIHPVDAYKSPSV